MSHWLSANKTFIILADEMPEPHALVKVIDKVPILFSAINVQMWQAFYSTTSICEMRRKLQFAKQVRTKAWELEK